MLTETIARGTNAPRLILFTCKTLLTAVSSDSRPPNPKCLTAIIVFDI